MPGMTKRQRNRRSGLDLICRRHGVEQAFIQAKNPKDGGGWDVRCKNQRGVRRCRHWEDATDRQAAHILKAYPEIDAREYAPDRWKLLFED